MNPSDVTLYSLCRFSYTIVKIIIFVGGLNLMKSVRKNVYNKKKLKENITNSNRYCNYKSQHKRISG